MTIIDGKILAEKIKDDIVEEITALNANIPLDSELPGLLVNRPNLAIILIGDREDSVLYVDLKEKEAKKVGIDTHVYKCPDNIPEQEIFDMINILNRDDMIDAILVQLPLPKNIDTDKIMRAIDPKKDVDRFHPDNLAILLQTCNHDHVMPPVFKVVIEMLKDINCELEDKAVCIAANSEIFGQSLKKVLECRGARAQITHPDDDDFKVKTSQADILISAIGRKNFIKEDAIKEDAVVIDIGITKEGGKVYGDVDFEEAKDKAEFITPVPGGVGPVTIAMLFRNTLDLYKERRKN